MVIKSKFNFLGLKNKLNNKKHQIILTPIPFEATVSNGWGTSKSFPKIIKNSEQIDFINPFISNNQQHKNNILCNDIFYNDYLEFSKHYQELINNGIRPNYWGNKIDNEELDYINKGLEKIHNGVKNYFKENIDKNKTFGIIGGEHSVSLGYISALCEIQKKTISILHIDAHSDLREHYEGVKYSHASVMRNVLEKNEQKIRKLVQVGVRDTCEEEIDFICDNRKIVKFSDEFLTNNLFEGRNYEDICDQIIGSLHSDNIYISIDVDGLDPSLCPMTGTPIPGGLQYNQLLYLLSNLSKHNRKIIGFDVVEVGNGDWDALVASKIIYFMSNLILNQYE